MEYLLRYWKPKKIASIPQIMKETYKMAFFSKIKVKRADKKNYFWEVNDCKVCGKGYIEKDIKFCDCIAGIVETIINHFSEIYPHIPKVKVTTLTCRASGDKSCKYYIEVFD